MLEPPKFTRMEKLLVLKKLCFVMQIALHNKRVDLHDESFILKSLT